MSCFLEFGSQSFPIYHLGFIAIQIYMPRLFSKSYNSINQLSSFWDAACFVQIMACWLLSRVMESIWRPDTIYPLMGFCMGGRRMNDVDDDRNFKWQYIHYWPFVWPPAKRYFCLGAQRWWGYPKTPRNRYFIPTDMAPWQEKCVNKLSTQ